jgi:hypothetical protein
MVHLLKKKKIPVEIILFDEGTHLLFAMDKIFHNKDHIDFTYLSFKRKMKNWIFRTDFRPLIPDKIFTSYFKKETYPKIVENHFSLLKTNIQELKKTQDVYFLGQPLSLKEMSEDHYIEMLQQVAGKYSKIKYIIHRYESELSLSRIKRISNIEVVVFDDCVELEFVRKGFLPHQILGFTTSALISMEKIFSENIQFKSFIIPHEILNSHFRDRMKTIYDYFRKNHHIKIEELDLPMSI